MPFAISSLVSYEEDIKKSRFQAFAVPVENEQAVKDFLEQYKDISTTHQWMITQAYWIKLEKHCCKPRRKSQH
jgi:putative IMPACT (imprinted ancient) family translation regulator